MFTHLGCNTLAPGALCDNITTIADMATQAGLVGLYVVAACNPVIGVGRDIGSSRLFYPGATGFILLDGRRVRTGLPGTDYGFNHIPCGRPVPFLKATNPDHYPLLSRNYNERQYNGIGATGHAPARRLGLRRQEDVDRQSYLLGLTQVITRDMLLEANFETITYEGFLNKPYRSVLYLDQDSAPGYSNEPEL